MATACPLPIKNIIIHFKFFQHLWYECHKLFGCRPWKPNWSHGHCISPSYKMYLPQIWTFWNDTKSWCHVCYAHKHCKWKDLCFPLVLAHFDVGFECVFFDSSHLYDGNSLRQQDGTKIPKVIKQIKILFFDQLKFHSWLRTEIKIHVGSYKQFLSPLFSSLSVDMIEINFTEQLIEFYKKLFYTRKYGWPALP